MGILVRKTEHAGPKKGNGAYWGMKWEVKRGSRKLRRRLSRDEIKHTLFEKP